MKKFLFFVVLLLIIVGMGVGAILNFSKSTGNRSGKLVNLSKVGLIIKTYEGTLDLGSGDQLTWSFSIHDDKLGEALMKQTGKMVRLDFKEHLYPLIYGTKFNVISWENVQTGVDDPLCRLVGSLLVHPEVVDMLRPEIEERDQELLREIRKCQKMIKEVK